jgi:hypothetical protein
MQDWEMRFNIEKYTDRPRLNVVLEGKRNRKRLCTEYVTNIDNIQR